MKPQLPAKPFAAGLCPTNPLDMTVNESDVISTLVAGNNFSFRVRFAWRRELFGESDAKNQTGRR
jgi:hypothetical protein